MHYPTQARASHDHSAMAHTAAKGFFFALAVLAGIGLLSAESPAGSTASVVDSLKLSAAERASFDKGEDLVLKHSGSEALRFLPPIAGKDAITARVASVKPQIILEVLQAFPLPARLASASDPATAVLELYNTFHQFRTMEGIKYWSRTENQEKVLYTYSRVVASPQDRRELPDPKYTRVEGRHRLWVVQEDSRMGRNLYSMEVENLDDRTVSLGMGNEEQMWLGPVPVVRPQGMFTRVVIILEKDRAVFYGVTALDVAGVMGIDERISDSYQRRFQALYRWLKDSLKA